MATRAVEVSLDLDYERGYTEPAPADALGQRLGRVNRKGVRPPALIVIFEQPSAGHLYNEAVTHQTVELLAQAGLLTEQRLTDIVDEIYIDDYQGQDLIEYQQGLSHPTINYFERELIAGTYKPWVEDVIQKADRQELKPGPKNSPPPNRLPVLIALMWNRNVSTSTGDPWYGQVLIASILNFHNLWKCNTLFNSLSHSG